MTSLSTANPHMRFLEKRAKEALEQEADKREEEDRHREETGQRPGRTRSGFQLPEFGRDDRPTKRARSKARTTRKTHQPQQADCYGSSGQVDSPYGGQWSGKGNCTGYIGQPQKGLLSRAAIRFVCRAIRVSLNESRIRSLYHDRIPNSGPPILRQTPQFQRASLFCQVPQCLQAHLAGLRYEAPAVFDMGSAAVSRNASMSVT